MPDSLSPLTRQLVEEGMKPRKVKAEVRHDQHGPMRLMARAEGYVMVRRPMGAMPRVLSEREWNALPSQAPGAAA